MSVLRITGMSGALLVVFLFLSALMFRQLNTSYWLLCFEWALVLLAWVLARWVDPVLFRRHGAPEAATDEATGAGLSPPHYPGSWP